jgi:hypothetical protein
MPSRATALAIVLLCCAAPAAAQGPRVSALYAPIPALQPFGLGMPHATARRPTLFRPDSVVIQPTYWVEGGLVGGVAVGVMGSLSCKVLAPRTSCYVLAFAFTGTFIGFPLGALVGGLFPKS